MDEENTFKNTLDLIFSIFNVILYKCKVLILNRIKTIVLICLITKVTASFLGHIFDDFTNKLDDSFLHYEPDKTTIYNRRPHPLTNGTEAPYFLEDQTRYVGEDARFDCEQVIWGLNTSIPHINQVIWQKDGKFLIPDERHSISWTFQTIRKGQIPHDLAMQSFKIKSTLKITMINESDFGIYYCHVSERTNAIYKKETNETKKTKVNNENSWNPLVWNSEFHLNKCMPSVKTVFVAPGTVFSFGAYFRHDLGNNDYFTLYYTVNGQEPVVQESRCSIFVLLYNALSKGRIFDTYRLLTRQPILGLHRSEMPCGNITRKCIFSRLQHCVTPNSYGIYEMVILRKIFNERDKTYDIHEINYPQKIDVKPKESDLFVFAENSGTDTTEDPTNDYDVDCWNMETNSPSVIVNCRLIKRLVHKIANDLHFRDVAYFVFAVLFLVDYIYSLYKYGKNLAIILFSCRDIAITVLAGIRNEYEMDKTAKYHVFISYCENDEQRARNLTYTLEEKGLKVFLRSRDMSPGRPRLTDIGNAIDQSAVVFVIASAEYVQNLDFHEFERNMILEKVKKNTLFVIKVDDGEVKNIFKGQYVRIDIKDDSINGWAKQMTTWLNRPTMNHASCVNKELKTWPLYCLLYFLYGILKIYMYAIFRLLHLAHEYWN